MAAMIETQNENQFDLNNLEKWDKIRYFSFKNRKRYPNLFFYYFNYEGKLNKEFSTQEKNKLLSIVSKDQKSYNGLWGYFSLNFNNKNGLEIYKFFSKLQLFSCSNSLPCIQDAKPYSEDIKRITEEIFDEKEKLYQEIEKKLDESLKNIDDGKYEEYNDFYKNERFIFHSHKANLKNFLNSKYDEIKENENFELQIDINKINNINNKEEQEKKKKNCNPELKIEGEEIKDNTDNDLLQEENKSEIISNLSFESEKSSSSDSSFVVVCKKNPRKRIIYDEERNEDKEFNPNSNRQENISNNKDKLSLNNDSIQFKETLDLTPKKPNIFDSLFDSEVKYQVFEEKQDGFYSDNFKNVFISDNESVLSDDENNKNKFNKFNLDLKYSRKDSEEFNTNHISRIEGDKFEQSSTNHNKTIYNLRKELDEIENFCKSIKAKKKFLVVKEDKNSNKMKQDKATLKNKKQFEEDRENIINANLTTHLEKCYLKNEKGDDISSICMNEKNYKFNDVGEFSSIKNINYETPMIKKKNKPNFSDEKKKENNILMKNFNIDLSHLSRFDKIKDDNLYLKKLEPKRKRDAFITSFNIREKMKKKPKVEKSKYPEFKENLRRVYAQKKKKTKDRIKKNELIFKGLKEFKRNINDPKYCKNPFESNLNQINANKMKYVKNLNLLSRIISKKKTNLKKDLYAIEEESLMQIDDECNLNPSRSKKSKQEMTNLKKNNIILDDNSSDYMDDNNSKSFLDIANNRKPEKKSTVNSKNNFINNRSNFYDSANNSLNLGNFRDYMNKFSTQPNQNQKSENERKIDLKEKASNYLFVKQFKHNTINFAFSDNSSVTSSERSSNLVHGARAKTSNPNVKNNLKKNNNPLKNHHILDFFHANNFNKEKEEELLRMLLKLFKNEKYSKLISLLDNNREILASISSSIHQYSDKIISEFNIINEEIVNFERNKIKDLSLDEYVFYFDSDTRLDFKLDCQESFKNLFMLYKENLFDFINLFYFDKEDEDSTNRNTIKLNEEDKMKLCIVKIIMSENIIKTFIKLSDNIITFNVENKIDKFSFIDIALKNIKELFLFFLKKVLLDHDFFKEKAYNIKNSSLEYSDFNIFSDFLINRLGVFIIMVENLVNVQNNLIKKINNDQNQHSRKTNTSDIIKKLTNDLNNFIAQFNQFLMILAYLVLIKIYGLDFSELNMKKFDKNKLNQNFQYMSLLKIISETLFRLDSSKKNKKIELDLLESILSLIKRIINDYLLVGMNGDSNSNFDFEDMLNSKNNKNLINKKDEKNQNENNLNNNPKNFLRNMKLNFYSILKNIIYENVVNKEVLHKKFKSILYKIFMCMTNNIIDSGSLSIDIKKFIHNQPFIDLYRRYFNILIVIFFDSDFKNSKSILNEELLEKNIQIPDAANRMEKLNQTNIYSYYDLENLIKNLNNHELRNKINVLKKTNLFNEYLLSDLKTLIILDKYWKIEPISIIKYIFLLLNIINSKHRRYRESECLKQNKFMYKLIDFLFTNVAVKDKNLNLLDKFSDKNDNFNDESFIVNEDDEEECDFFQMAINFPQHLEFIFKISRIIRKMLSNCKEEKNKIKILSLFVNQYSMFSIKSSVYKDNIIENNPPKLNSICILSVAFSFVEFANSFDGKEDIESSLKRLKEILDFSKSSIFIKGINIAMSIKIVLNYSKRNISLVEPINNLSNQMKYLYEQINHYEILNSNNKKNLNEPLQNNRNVDSDFLKNEIFPTLHFLLNNLLTISKEKPEIIVNNPSILEEIKNLLQTKLKIAINYKQIIINIISNCMDKCEIIIKENFEKNAFIEEDGMILDIPLEFLDETEIIKSFCKNEFVIKIKNHFIPILNSLIHSLILENKENSGSLGQTLSFPFLKSVADCFTKICSILYKYQVITSNILNDKFNNKSGFFSSNLRKILINNPKSSKNLNITNGELLEGITQIPFMAFSKFLNFDSKNVQIDLKKEKDLVISLMKMLLYALFYNPYYQNIKLTYEIFSKMSQSNDGKYLLNANNKKESENFLLELLKFLSGQRGQAHQMIIDLRKDMLINSNYKRDDLNYLNMILFFSEERILNLIRNISKSSNNFYELFDIFFNEYLNLDESSNNPIELGFFSKLINDLEEIIHRGVSLESIRKNKELVQKDFNSDNYCFTICNFYFRILNLIDIKNLFVYSRINHNRILIDFVNKVQKSIGGILSDFSFKELSYKNLTIGFNIFKFCAQIVDLVLNDTGSYNEIKDKNYAEKVEFFITTFSNYLTYIVYRIKEFLDYYLTSNINLIHETLEQFGLQFSLGFYHDYYFKKEKMKHSHLKKKKILLRIKNEKFCLMIKEENKIRDLMGVKIPNDIEHPSQNLNHMVIDLEAFNSTKQDSISLINSLNKKDHLVQIEKEQVSENVLREEKHINEMNNLMNKNTGSNFVLTQNLDLDLDMDEIENLFNNDDHKPATEENKIILKSDLINSEHESFKERYIKNMISIIKYISSKKYLYDYSFSSKSYYLFILFTCHKIVNNYICDDVYLQNFHKMIACINFYKYPIMNFEDLFLNIHIIKIFELSIEYEQNLSKNKNKFEVIKIISYNSCSTKFTNKLYADFIKKALEYVLEILNFLCKYCISLNKFNKMSEFNVFMNGKKSFLTNEKKLNSINTIIEKALKQLFNRDCYELFKNEKEIIIPQEAFKEENKSILKIFYFNKNKMMKNLFVSMIKIFKSIKSLVLNNDFSLSAVNDASRSQISQILENGVFAVEFFIRVFDIGIEEEAIPNYSDHKPISFRDRLSPIHQMKIFFDDFDY